KAGPRGQQRRGSTGSILSGWHCRRLAQASIAAPPLLASDARTATDRCVAPFFAKVGRWFARLPGLSHDLEESMVSSALQVTGNGDWVNQVPCVLREKLASSLHSLFTLNTACSFSFYRVLFIVYMQPPTQLRTVQGRQSELIPVPSR